MEIDCDDIPATPTPSVAPTAFPALANEDGSKGKILVELK